MFFVFCLIMTENQSKKKVFLSVKQKMTIVEKLQARTSVKMLCREYGVSWDVIHRIRREYKLLSNFGNRGGHILQQKSKKILEWKYKKSFIYVVLTTISNRESINRFIITREGNGNLRSTRINIIRRKSRLATQF